jgi:hypothetical protein
MIKKNLDIVTNFLNTMLNIVDSTKEKNLKTITMAKDNVVRISIHQG